MTATAKGSGVINFQDKDNNLDVDLWKEFLSKSEEEELYSKILESIRWYRVKYKSSRFQSQCTTPCWTNFYGGYKHIKQYKEVPQFLNPIIEKVSKACKGAKFNAILLRLYFDGNDNIAWHTDGRTFLGKEPVIASLSLGYPATFEMRKMTNVWPCGMDNGIDTKVPVKKFKCEGGDMLVMKGKTQQSWHHRVPKEIYRRPRININFRYILPNRQDTERGQHSYYKYMVYGDEENPKGFVFDEIRKNTISRTSLESFWHTKLPGKRRKRKLCSAKENIANVETMKTKNWVCRRCTLINNGSTNVCAACFFSRTTLSTVKSKKKRKNYFQLQLQKQ